MLQRSAQLVYAVMHCKSNDHDHVIDLPQVLYFIPELREAILALRPEPEEEFSMLDELTLLFRMLTVGGPAACLATNLLRALRQNRGAAALGLLEIHSQRSGENSDIEVRKANICSGSRMFSWSSMRAIIRPYVERKSLFEFHIESFP